MTELKLALGESDDERGRFPLFDGLLAYFPNALCAVAEVSKIGNDKHNPGQPMHWARGKSMDHGNKILRHQIDAGGKDANGVRHSAYVAWRALAQLQQELEEQEGVPMSRASKLAECPVEAAIMPELRDLKVGDRVRNISAAAEVGREFTVSAVNGHQKWPIECDVGYFFRRDELEFIA